MRTFIRLATYSLIFLLLVRPAAALAPAGQNAGNPELISVGSDGLAGNGPSSYSSISADGRYVAFWSEATNLVPDDTNGCGDVFVRDRQTGTTLRVSTASDGTQANDRSGSPSISADGRIIAFWSQATNLVADDKNGLSDIFVHILADGVTEMVSLTGSGQQANGTSTEPSISADGRYVAFESNATNLVADDTNEATDIFVRDRLEKTTERISVNNAGSQANSTSYRPSISADGQHVSFQSFASNLAAGDTNGYWDIFVRDRTGVTEQVSSGYGEITHSVLSYISANGQSITYLSELGCSGSCVCYEFNRCGFVIGVPDRITGSFQRIAEAGCLEYYDGVVCSYLLAPVISANGRFVAYYDKHTMTKVGGYGYFTRVYDRLFDVERLVSFVVIDEGIDYYLERPSISADGRYVSFESPAGEPVSGGLMHLNVFVWEWIDMLNWEDMEIVYLPFMAQP